MSIINLIIERETPQGNLGIGGTGDRTANIQLASLVLA